MNRDVQLQIEGSLLERLMEQALHRGARFARVRRMGPRRILLTADPMSAGIMMQLCQAYGLNACEVHRGVAAALKQLIRSRWTLLPGMLFCIIICALFLGRIWLVDVALTSSGSRSEILRCLQENGIHAGIPAWKIDPDLLGKQLLADTGNYSHIGVRIQGVRLLVEASAELPAPETHDIRQPVDLIAGRSGVVHEIEVYSGEACVRPGDTVLAGEVLIRGEETIGKDAETGEDITVPVRATGRVNARCWFEGHARGEISADELLRTGESCSEYRLRLLDFGHPLTQCSAYPLEECETEKMPIVGLFLPLEIERITHYETRKHSLEIKPEMLAAKLELLARADALRQIDASGIDYEPAVNWLDVQTYGNTLQVRAVYEIYTDIAMERDAQTEEVY